MVDTAIGFLAAIFILGTPIFWFASLSIFAILVWLTECDHYFFASVTMAVFIFAMITVNSLTYNAIDYLKFAGLYFVLGTAWSFVKWISFLFKSRDKLKKAKLSWIDMNNKMVDKIQNDSARYGNDQLARVTLPIETTTKIPDDLFLDFVNSVKSLSYLRSVTVSTPKDLIPNIANFKGRVVGWIVWWPFSAFWTLLDDPIRRIATAIYNSLQGIYRSVANKIFGDFT